MPNKSSLERRKLFKKSKKNAPSAIQPSSSTTIVGSLASSSIESSLSGVSNLKKNNSKQLKKRINSSSSKKKAKSKEDDDNDDVSISPVMTRSMKIKTRDVEKGTVSSGSESPDYSERKRRKSLSFDARKKKKTNEKAASIKHRKKVTSDEECSADPPVNINNIKNNILKKNETSNKNYTEDTGGNDSNGMKVESSQESLNNTMDQFYSNDNSFSIYMIVPDTSSISSKEGESKALWKKVPTRKIKEEGIKKTFICCLEECNGPISFEFINHSNFDTVTFFNIDGKELGVSMSPVIGRHCRQYLNGILVNGSVVPLCIKKPQEAFDSEDVSSEYENRKIVATVNKCVISGEFDFDPTIIDNSSFNLDPKAKPNVNNNLGIGVNQNEKINTSNFKNLTVDNLENWMIFEFIYLDKESYKRYSIEMSHKSTESSTSIVKTTGKTLPPASKTPQYKLTETPKSIIEKEVIPTPKDVEQSALKQSLRKPKSSSTTTTDVKQPVLKQSPKENKSKPTESAPPTKSSSSLESSVPSNKHVPTPNASHIIVNHPPPQQQPTPLHNVIPHKTHDDELIEISITLPPLQQPQNPDHLTESEIEQVKEISRTYSAKYITHLKAGSFHLLAPLTKLGICKEDQKKATEYGLNGFVLVKTKVEKMQFNFSKRTLEILRIFQANIGE